ncbi:hypothetical protein LJC06_03840, partial [Bacteroidales bacterium OttesenSCG-928-I14]|nr:hypothetical protein [Bacteroidales bacterium OttesenSCG-928-I14]
LNLYNIGYSAKRISRYYQVVVSTITSISIVFSVIVCYIIRSVYLDKFKGFFELQSLSNYLFPTAAILLLLLVVAYNVLLLRNVRKIVS